MILWASRSPEGFQRERWAIPKLRGSRRAREPLPREPASAKHRNLDLFLPGEGDGRVVSRVGVAGDAEPRIGGQDALEAPGGGGPAVGDDDHPGMDRIADPHSPAMVDRDPGRPGGRVQEGVQNRPVGDGVGSSFIPSVSRFGEATEPASRWSRPMTIGAFIFPRDHID